jgi:hypothetical protein
MILMATIGLLSAALTGCRAEGEIGTRSQISMMR